MMCGIFGIVGRDCPDRLIAAFQYSLRHRGPDGCGAVRVADDLVLGHVRLAINDLSAAGGQPMTDPLTGNIVVFNGEIYNFKELRQELAGLGCQFLGHSDTEVLLHGFGQWGPSVIEKLVGMFAFALWDQRERTLILARDRMGEKPLYLAELPHGGIAFSSELRPLLLLPELADRRINHAALRHYLAHGYTSTAQSICDGITKLPPAHWLLVRDGRIAQRQEYWSLKDAFAQKQRYASIHEAMDVCGEHFTRAVRGQLVSDVPVGAFLSGGVDSGLVASFMKQQDQEVCTFTAGFDQPEFDERIDANALSDRLGTTHTAFSLGEPTFEQILAPYRATDEPFADTSAMPTYYLAQRSRRHVSVCLSGDGGDELFAGYPTYVADKIYWLTRWMPRWVFGLAQHAATRVASRHGKVGFDYKLKAFLRGAQESYTTAHDSWRALFSDRDIDQLLGASVSGNGDPAPCLQAVHKYWADLPEAHYLDRAMYVDMKTWLVDNILFKVDRMSMAHSLEVRAPFLDHRLVEFAASLPMEYKLDGFQGKVLLKQLALSRFGVDYRHTKKRGFNSPFSRWISVYRSEFEDYLVAAGHLNAEMVSGLLNEHVAMKHDNGFKIACLTGLAAWLEGVH